MDTSRKPEDDGPLTGAVAEPLPRAVAEMADKPQATAQPADTAGKLTNAEPSADGATADAGAAEPKVKDAEAAPDDTTQTAGEWDKFAPRFAIGRGQFGVVYLLQHPDGRKAVDKRVELSGMTDKQKEETNAEIDLLKKLAHGTICAYFHHFVTDDTKKENASTLHIVMEYCDSGSMADAVSEQQQAKKKFDHFKIRSWVSQLTRALAHIHSLRVIHRDIKTANIFLAERGKSVPDVKIGGCSMVAP